MDLANRFDFIDFSASNFSFALLAAAGCFLLAHGLLAFVRRKLARLSEERAHRPVASVLEETLARTSSFFVFVFAVLVGLSVLDLDEQWSERVRHLWFLALGAQVAIYLSRAIAFGSERYFAGKSQAAGTPVSVAHTLIVWVLQTALWVVFVLAMLANLGINVTTFVASLGIGGVAVALAVQNILGDLFASLSIAVDKPFEVGDAISVSGFSGTVEHVGLKTTRVRADSGEQIVIANAELLKNTLRNYKRMSERRVQFSVKTSPATPRKLAAQLPAALRAIIEKQQDLRFDRAHLKAIDQNWLEFEVVYFVKDPAYAIFMDRQQAILLEIQQALSDLGISTRMAARHWVLEDDPVELASPNLRRNETGSTRH